MYLNVVIYIQGKFLRESLETHTATATVKGLQPRRIARGHIRALDGLRGVAILLVLYYHFTNHYINLFNGILYQFSDFGWCGVDLFFVLSGFLITGILYDAKSDQHYFQKFYMRRVLRIFPLYYGFLFVFFVLVPLEHQYSPAVRNHIVEQVWLWSYLTNFYYFLSPHLLLNQLYLFHFWSLAVEEQFYLIWPAVIFFSKPKTAIRISAICIGVALVLRVLLVADHVSAGTIFNLTFCRMDSLAIGALCALLVRTDVATNNLMKAARWIILISGGALLVTLLRRGGADANNPVMQSIGYSLLAFFFGAVLLLSLNPSKRNILSWTLGCPVLVTFGFYSYALYVFHFPLIHIFNKWFPVRRFSLDFHSGVLGLETHVLCSILASFLVAVLSWNLYEKHFLKLKKYFVLTTKGALAEESRRQAKVERSFLSGPKRMVREFGVWFNQRPFLNKLD